MKKERSGGQRMRAKEKQTSGERDGKAFPRNGK
jgi:hypothetical protein